MNLNEQISKIKNIIYELSPQSAGVSEFLETVKDFPELIQHLGFSSFNHLKSFVLENDYDDFKDLRSEMEYFFDRRKRYFKDEMDEFERASQDLNRDEGMNISVDEILRAFQKSKEATLEKDIWSKLENTESCDIKKGELKKVVQIAKKYNKQNPLELKKALLSGDYRRPLILKFNDRYHLVAGNTRLCTAAALGIKPKILIGKL
jgi:hypothetical protein